MATFSVVAQFRIPSRVDENMASSSYGSEIIGCLCRVLVARGGEGGGGGDSAPCETCDSSASFDFNTDTLGGTDTAFGTNNYNIYGFESGGSLCFNALHVNAQSQQSSVTVYVADWSIYGYVQPNTQIVNGDIIYKAANGTCYRGTLSEGSNMCLISPM